MAAPEVVLLVSTYQRPEHLRRALLSIACQRDVLDKIEVVVTDDGSRDETPQVVEDFARRMPFPVAFTTHPRGEFQLARCRNEGLRASSAPYVLFLDGDCLLPPDYVARQLALRRPGAAFVGDCCRLDEATSQAISDAHVRAGRVAEFAPARERRRLWGRHLKACWQGWIGHASKPRVMGGCTALWRADFEAVNGYDENFLGWGCEDDDLSRRLRRGGVAIRSYLGQTYSYHLWHPPAPSRPERWRDGANVDYLKRRLCLTRCLNGARSLDLGDVTARLHAGASRSTLAGWLPPWLAVGDQPADLEIAAWPEATRFPRGPGVRVLAALGERAPPRGLQDAADLVFGGSAEPSADGKYWPLQALASVLEHELERGLPRRPLALAAA